VRNSCQLASKVLGADVENPPGEKLGDIRDIVLDSATGRIRYAVVGAGGFLGLGEKYFAFPWTALTSKAGKRRILSSTVQRS